ncbi:phosphatase YidA (plasmid) [Peptoclostridium acidaminophilum DSM 3953]|uniref:Phosphatase YidA n=1 Tax=Peptoclostridium acidaminophilum DSM 3953 TaxID=1286171 RepID=W8T8M6_PEPAC|nr:Cof-type HAD-IIB family hydrolase [Peptoclostridium acidaminophilum]AHM58049.1 phosphatase YidA [Peptoclostridium acidaminophilum DSM 3953]
MNNYKLCVLDMDGTMLASDHSIPVKNIEAIGRLAERGISVVVATGRMDIMIKSYIKQMKLDLPVISCNGGMIRRLGENNPIAEFPIDADKVLGFINACRAAGVSFSLYGRHSMFTEKLDGRALFFHEYNKTLPDDEKIDIQVVPSCRALVENGMPIIKGVLYTDDYEALETVRQEVDRIEGVAIVQSGKGLYDFMRAEVSKGRAVEQLAQIMGIGREQVVAFGDNHNDISMLKFAGLAVAMGNAEEDVKRHADFVTLTNDEAGVAYAIDKLVLSENAHRI